ncbi:MAG: serine hydrolase domain-containing protein [Steroidobacteraceae bacterium]
MMRALSRLPAVVLLCLCVNARAQDAALRMSEAKALAALQAELQRRSTTDEFSGAVLIAKEGKAIFQMAYGAANREQKVANTLATPFRFGSMGKMFTGVAVLQLVQAGRVGLSDPLSKYLPDYPNRSIANASLHQLLTHTAGTGDIFTPEYDARRGEMKELQDYVALYGARRPDFDPGLKHEYSNYGFILLGRVIEVVSGQRYADYVREHIFKPAGMLATDNLPEAQVKNLAIPYSSGVMRRRLLPPLEPGADTPNGAPPLLRGMAAGEQLSPMAAGDAPETQTSLRSVVAELPYSGSSAGGGYTTVGDLLKFAIALQSYKLLDAQHTQLLTTGKVATPRANLQYAYGFEDARSSDGVRRLGHGGGTAGVNGELSIFPESKYTVIVLANRDPPAADEVASFINERLPAE